MMRDYSEEGREHRCPECGSGNVLDDEESGERVCKNCGMVISDVITDTGPEWRAFTKQEKDAKARTGAPSSPLYVDRGSVITYPKGKENTPEMRRMIKWNRRAKVTESKERNLNKAMNEINRLGDQLKVPKRVKERAAVIYKDALRNNLVRGRSIDEIAAASMKAAFKQMDIQRPLKEITKKTHVDHKAVARSYRLLVYELGLKTPAPDPRKMVDKIAEELDLPGDVRQHTNRILKKCMDLKITGGKSPSGMVSAAIYIASDYKADIDEDYKKVRKTQRDIAMAADVTEVTIRNRYKDIENKFESEGIDVEELVEGIETIDVTVPKSKPKKKNKQPIDGEYVNRLKQLSHRLDLDVETYNMARDIYTQAIEEGIINENSKKIGIDASLAVAMRIYNKQIFPYRNVSKISNNLSHEIRNLQERLYDKIEMELPEVEMSEYIDYISRFLVDVEDYVMESAELLLNEYKIDNNEIREEKKATLALSAIKKACSHYKIYMSHLKIAETIGIDPYDVSKTDKEIDKYDIKNILQDHELFDTLIRNKAL